MSTFLKAEWRKLLMVNYLVDKTLLKPYLPNKTEIDFWNNRCYISLVGFLFQNTAVNGFKIPFHINFEEVNLRFYVRHNDKDESKRGVVFIKEIVPRPAITFIAKERSLAAGRGQIMNKPTQEKNPVSLYMPMVTKK